MVNHLHFSLKDTGTVLACFGLGAVSGNFLGGWLTDKAGHFKVQLISLFLTVPVFIVLPQLETVGALAAGVFILSLVSEAFRPANSVSVAYYSNSDNVVRSFSLNRMALNLGFSIGPALGGFLAAISYSFLFYGNAIAACCSGLLFFLYFRNLKGNKKVKETDSDQGNQVAGRSPYRDLPYLLFSLLCAVFAICFLQLLNTLPLYYRTIYKLSETEIGIIMAFSGMVVFLFEMLLVHIAERNFTSRVAIIAGTLLCALSFLILNLAKGVPVLYLSMFVICIAEILAIPFMSTVTLQRSSPDKRGAYMALNALSFSIGHIFSPFIGTRVAAAYGFEILWWGTTAALVIAAAGFFFVMRMMR
jgi:predicted MFS family arabinose efflux permease